MTSVAVMRGYVTKLELKKERMAYESKVGFTTATELADTIVRETGLPFRTAYRIVASMAEEKEKEHEHGETNIVDADLNRIDEFSVRITGKRVSELGLTPRSVKEALDIVSNINRRNVTGGPARKEVMRMLRAREDDLNRDDKLRETKEEHVKLCLRGLEREVEKMTRSK